MTTKQVMASIIGFLAILAIALPIFREAFGDIQSQQIESVCGGGCGYVFSSPILSIVMVVLVVLAVTSMVAGWPIGSAQMRR